MGTPICRLGDTSTHGGEVIEGSPNLNCDGIPVARMGDKFQCPSHGLQQVLAVDGIKEFNQGKPITTVGAEVTCGAIMIQGSPTANAG